MRIIAVREVSPVGKVVVKEAAEVKVEGGVEVVNHRVLSTLRL